MNQDVFIYTLPQWFIFSAIAVIIYGWIEKKQAFRLIGLFIFVVLGVFSIYTIQAGYFSASHLLTPEELTERSMGDETYTNLPFQARLLPAYWSFVITALLAVPALYFDWKNIKPRKLFTILASLVALFGFFIIVGELRML